MSPITWFKVDDGLHSHPKALAAGDAALGLWVRLGSWSSKHLTDGFIPGNVATTLGRPRPIRKLVDVGFLEAIPGGYRLHDFHDYNPTKEQVEAERAETAERVAEWRAKKKAERQAKKAAEAAERAETAESNATCNSVTPAVTPPVCNSVRNGVRTGAPTRPDPTRSSSYVERDVDVAEPALFGEVIDGLFGRPA